jgi:REP element-mobilizing transposase RayT
MPRASREVSFDFPYHLRNRCINKEWFSLPMHVVWEIFSEQLYLANKAFNLQIHSFVLMSNHYHLLASTPEGNLSECMRYFQTEVSREITRLSRRINQTFGGPFGSTVIGSNHYFLAAYKYVYRNPVKAGLVERAENYRYSTLNGLIGRSKLIIPLCEDSTLFSDVEGTLNWIGTAFTENHSDQIQKALRRREFKYPVEKIGRKPSELEKIIP